MAAAVSNPETATDSVVDDYADNYFGYDAQRSVSKEIAQGAGCSACTGGQGTFTYSYEASTNPVGFNSWAVKTEEHLPDGSVRTVFTNAYGQVMLTEHKSTPSERHGWIMFNRYDSAGRLLWAANPSAFIPAMGARYDATRADLLDFSTGDSPYLYNNIGLITVYSYGAGTTATESTAGDVLGYWKTESVKRGETGAPIKQAEWTYIKSPTSAYGVSTYQVASESVFRSEASGGSDPLTTTHAYTYHTDPSDPDPAHPTIFLPRVRQETITYAAVSTDHNGPGTATADVVVYDLYGRPVWVKDAAGNITYTEYDAKTGAVVKTIADVNTANISDFSGLPGGWTTPPGGGAHTKTLFEVDVLGRPVKITHPGGQRIDYIVYNDTAREIRTYVAWDGTTQKPTGPTVVVRQDVAAGYTETLTMSAAPAVDVYGRPTGAEPIAGVQSLSREHYNSAWQMIDRDEYFNLAGLTYSTSASLGQESVNFYRTRFKYDQRGRLHRTQTPS